MEGVNCKSDLYCYQGFCRNPDCPNESDCTCKATSTPTPTPKPKVTPKPSQKPTPEVVTLGTTRPISTISATYNPTASPNSLQDSSGSNLKRIIITAGVALVIIFMIILIARSLKKNEPPLITPLN